MAAVPILWDGELAGELTFCAEGLYTRFEAAGRTPLPEPMRLVAVGERGELRLGVPEARGSGFSLRRRLSNREAAGAGTLARCELRRCVGEEKAGQWRPLGGGERLFRSAALQAQAGLPGVLVRREGERAWVAIPFDSRRPFPLTGLFCFARIRWIGEHSCVVYGFDREERPVL